MPAEVLFQRALKSMELSVAQRTANLTLLDSRQLAHSVQNLKDCSIRLFGTYKETSDAPKGDLSTFLAQNLDDGNLSAEETDVFLVRKKKGARNKHGMGGMAVGASGGNMNIPKTRFF